MKRFLCRLILCYKKLPQQLIHCRTFNLAPKILPNGLPQHAESRAVDDNDCERLYLVDWRCLQRVQLDELLCLSRFFFLLFTCSCITALCANHRSNDSCRIARWYQITNLYPVGAETCRLDRPTRCRLCFFVFHCCHDCKRSQFHPFPFKLLIFAWLLGFHRILLLTYLQGASDRELPFLDAS